MLELENEIDTPVYNLESLLSFNESYYQQFISQPFFKLIESGLLNQDEKKQHAFFNYVQIFSDHFQTMLHMRQATCRDEKFYPSFLEHMLDELGHDDLLRQRKNKKITKAWDPILVATSTWFVHQMQILDNLEKAVIMHLVLEKTGDYYHVLGNKHIGKLIDSNYYEVHAEHDENHAEMITDLLHNYPEFTYQRLKNLLKESWQMMYTMSNRVYELVMTETQKSSDKINSSVAEVNQSRNVMIISRDEIPPISQIEKDGKIETIGELRDFKWSAALKNFLPSDDSVSFSWVVLKPNETLRAHEHPTSSMIICYKGQGILFGDKKGLLKEGDVVAVPPFCQHGFTGAAPDGLWALSIQFGTGIYTDPQNARVTFLE